ncbi:MAG: hypothetical protein IJ324_12750 [Lachnospiraceae bacterium]|nr:hypothetical protein [Lachnospiraceae bacterium]
MKIFAIKDDDTSSKKTLAYLFYYETNKEFYIELPSDIDMWEAPLLLYMENNRLYKHILADDKLFREMKMQTDGYGITWEEQLSISCYDLFEIGTLLPLSASDFHDYIIYRTVGTTETCDILECTRQNVDDLIRRDKLSPIRSYAKSRLFLRSDVEKRLWN